MAPGQGAVDLPLPRVVRRHRQVPVFVARVQLLEVGRGRARRLLEIAALVHPQVAPETVLAPGERHELPHPLGPGPRVSVELEGRFLVGHVGEVLREALLAEDLLDHRQVGAGALQTRFELVPESGLERLDVRQDPWVQDDRYVVRDLPDHLLDLLALLLRLLGGQVGGDVLQLVEGRAVLLPLRLAVAVVQVGVHVGDVAHDLVEGLLERRLLVELDVARQHDVDRVVEVLLRLVEAPGLVGLETGLVGFLHLLAHLAYVLGDRLAARPVGGRLARHHRHRAVPLLARGAGRVGRGRACRGAGFILRDRRRRCVGGARARSGAGGREQGQRPEHQVPMETRLRSHNKNDRR